METPKDKRVKREIANSNERRRMQSINAGFQKLKRLLPVNDGEKLSKAAILQHASEFIQQTEREKIILYEQNTLLRRILMEVKGGIAISKALENIDLDNLPTIPIHTHLTINNNNISSNHSSSNNSSSNVDNLNAHINSNDTNTDNNSNDDCTRSSVAKEVTHKNSSRSGSKEVNRNNNSTSNNTCFISAQNNDNIKSNSQELTNVGEINSDRVASPKNGLVSTGIAKAAIALPLEVPYTLETAIRADPPSAPRKILKTGPPTMEKGQNLDTICKAIMEIEGDRVFEIENSL